MPLAHCSTLATSSLADEGLLSSPGTRAGVCPDCPAGCPSGRGQILRVESGQKLSHPALFQTSPEVEQPFAALREREGGEGGEEERGEREAAKYCTVLQGQHSGRGGRGHQL